MSTPQIRIFSYLPNPRVWKAQIAAEFCDVTVEVIGDKPAELARWLWDADARELGVEEMTDDSPYARISRRGFSGTLYKTDEFLLAHPYGTVPAAFSPDGSVGIFESNSILRATVRASDADHSLYGSGPYESSRIDSFLDAGLVFAREAQVYLLAMDDMSADTYNRMSAAYEFYLNGIEHALASQPFVAGAQLSIADIGFVCDTGQFLRERFFADALADKNYKPIGTKFAQTYPGAYRHLTNLAAQPEFSKYLGSFLRGL